MANSAKQQPGVISAHFNVAHTEFDSAHVSQTVTLKVPVDMWITEVIATFEQTTQFDTAVGVALELVPEQGLADSFSGATNVLDEVMDVWQTVDQVGSIILPHPHFLWICDTGIEQPVFWKQDNFQYLRAGEDLVVRLSMVDIGAGPAQGNMSVTIQAKTAVVNYNGSPKRPSSWSPDRAYLSILASVDAAESQFAWTPPTDLRFYNMRAMIMGTLGEDTFYGNAKGEVSSWNPFNVGTDTADYSVLPDIYVHNLQPATSEIYQVLNFEKGPVFLNKSEPFRFVHTQSGSDTKQLLFQCEIIPDYNNRITINGVAYNTNVSTYNEELVAIVVPWDIYLESVETDFVTAGATGDVSAFLEIHVIKPGDNLSSGVNSIGGQLLEFGSTAGNQQTGLLPSTVIDSLPIVIDQSVTTHASGTSLEMVMDFIPAGSYIVVNITAAAVSPSGLGTVECRVQIEGRNMVKHRNPSKFSYIHGPEIGSLDELGSSGGLSA